MRVHLAGWHAGASLEKTLDIVESHKPYALESFFYADEMTPMLIKSSRFFLFDSGAFSFLNTGKKVNLNEYTDEYISYIVQNGIQHYFELDIDPIVGYDKVLELRQRMERQVGIPPIPVWHKSRGIDDYFKTCDRYPYVAIGGLAIGEITANEYKALPTMIREAHKRGAIVHGLGFTKSKMLSKFHFDSVDSTSWEMSANRFGTIHKMRGGKIVSTTRPAESRVVDRNAILRNNLVEWIKFQKYADSHL